MTDGERLLVLASGQYGTIDAPTTYEYMYRNNLQGAKIPDAFGFRSEPSHPEHWAAVDRVIAYYRRLEGAYDLQSLKTEDMWGRLIDKSHQPFKAALAENDREAVSNALRDMCNTGLVTGFTEGLLSAPTEGFEYHRVVADQRMLVYEAWHIFDVLFSLAAALGHPIPCPEQGDQSLAFLDFESLLRFSVDRLPVLRRPPRAGGGAFGIRTSDGVIPIRDLFAAYNAKRVADILDASGDRKSVCEIGGGMGALTYYLATMGVSVSLFDLPIVSIVQAYYLISSISGDAVWVFGEEPNPAATVRVYPWWEMASVPDDEYSLVVNIDSLPEIELDVAANYIDLIHAKTTHWFLSVNQEARAGNSDSTAQNVVSDLIERRGGFRRMYRFPYWLRAGYVEELYRIEK